MPERTRNGFLPLTILFPLVSIVALTGCTATQQRMALLPADFAAEAGKTKSPPIQTTMLPSILKPLAVPGGGIATPSGPLLLVFTYGKGCPGDGPGNGLRDVADAIRVQYPGQQVITRGCDDEDGIEKALQNHRGPIAMVGHSFGGCRSLEMAARLRRSVDWLILLDPVPYNDWAFRHAGLYFQIPANIAKAVCFYRPAWVFPISYPIQNPLSPSDNRLRRWGHNAFCSDAEVRQCILGLCAEEQARTAQVSARG
jgi:pimeloyl-ACP methyl ester carboxylesterase